MPMTPKPDMVASEMEAIFTPVAGRERRPAHGEAPAAFRRRKRTGFSGWHLGVGAALVLVPLVTATLAIGDGRDYSLAPGAAASARQSPAVPTGPRPVARDGNSDMPAPTSEPLLASASAAADAPSVAAHAPPRRSAEPSRPAEMVARTPAIKASARDRTRVRTLPARRIDLARCAPGQSEQHCLFEDVLDADTRLRLAYDRADRAGVPTDTLTAINRSWRRARRYAEADPRGTIRRYERLADALDDERYGSDR